ncbi:hypothetical protein SLEP1_g20140 [Rubroshorea leprosula]|uniref:Uncharacterized protein n=1 Tax=Rubroshorea leprosula TaxID=152421 RepID=A0AAV5JAW5_9ROSI|nr:hypothetical protein SLEP1_g20140 [Rubroshorea leprosula]
MTDGGEYGDQNRLLRSAGHEQEDGDGDDVEAQGNNSATSNSSNNALKDIFKHLDRGFSGRRNNYKRLDREHSSTSSSVDRNHDDHQYAYVDGADALGDSAPPEWALLLIGCLLGLASGLCVAAFNKGVGFLL